MRSHRLLALSLAATTAWVTGARAQTAPATVADVVVTAERPAQRSAIDRKIYAVSRDLAAQAGSVSDVLRNLPAVEVDVEGNVSLRGDPSVKILIDGQPSILFSGSARAQALQQMAASTVEAIEVMTNPSAEFSPDGAGGIINIVMKKARKPGTSGSVQVGAGSLGRWSGGAMVAVVEAPLSVGGTFRLRRDAQATTNASSMIRIDPASGARTDIAQSGSQQYHSRGFALSGSMDYDATPQDRLSLSGFLNGDDGHRVSTTTEVRTNGVGVVMSDYDGLSINPYELVSVQGSANWRHTFTQKGRLFTLALRYTGQTEDNEDLLTYLYRAGGSARVEQRDTDSGQSGINLSAAYTLPLADGGTLKAGYDLALTDIATEFRGALVQPGGDFVPMAEVNNRFDYDQTNHQAWFTWQKPLGKFTALAGLRLESAAIDYDQITAGLAGHEDYLDVHPSLHLQYDLTETQKISASYSHRVSRPSSYQLNPFVRSTDLFNATAGNPALRPQEVHAVEAEWERTGDVTISANVYLRRYYNMIGDVDRFLSPTVVLHTFENQGAATSGGLDLTASGKFGAALSYRLNGTLAYSQIERPSTAGSAVRSAFSGGLKANFDWKASDADLFQLTGSWAGRHPTSQGYREPGGVVHFGYRRKLRPDLVAVVTVSDVFDSARRATVSDLPTIFGRSEGTGPGRTLMFSLTRQLGGKAARDTGFEYVN